MGKLLNVQEVCELLNVHRNTVMAWRKNEGLPFIKINDRNIKYDRDKVLEWLKKREQNTEE